VQHRHTFRPVRTLRGRALQDSPSYTMSSSSSSPSNNTFGPLRDQMVADQLDKKNTSPEASRKDLKKKSALRKTRRTSKEDSEETTRRDQATDGQYDQEYPSPPPLVDFSAPPRSAQARLGAVLSRQTGREEASGLPPQPP
jgi:hypothetical protein